MSASAEARPVRVILPRGPGIGHRLHELWTYRRLLPFFSKQYIRRRYLNTYLGWWWLPLRPVIEVGSRALLFGAVLVVPSEDVPYLLFLLIGMSCWQLIARGLYWTTRSTELNRGFLKRIYLPRLLLLVSSVAPEVLELGMYLAIAAVVLAYYAAVDGTFYLQLGPELLIAVAGYVMAIGLAWAIGLFTSVYGAQSRDMRFALAQVTRFWFFVTPVLYPSHIVPADLQLVLALNPATAPVEMVKWGLLGVGDVQPIAVISSLATIAIAGVAGLFFFASSEAAAVDNL